MVLDGAYSSFSNPVNSGGEIVLCEENLFPFLVHVENKSIESLSLFWGHVGEVVKSNTESGVGLVVLEDGEEGLLELLVSSLVLLLGDVALSVLGEELVEFRFELVHSKELSSLVLVES